MLPASHLSVGVSVDAKQVSERASERDTFALACVVTRLSAGATIVVIVGEHLFSQDRKVRLVRSQRKHDQIRILCVCDEPT